MPSDLLNGETKGPLERYLPHSLSQYPQQEWIPELSSRIALFLCSTPRQGGCLPCCQLNDGGYHLLLTMTKQEDNYRN